MQNETLLQKNDFIEIGKNRYSFTQDTQQFLTLSDISSYSKDTSVIIIHEPHDSSEGQYNLFKGLESFFASNPQLAKKTIFLSEGTTANRPISVHELIAEEPHPSDDIIRQVLRSFMITGYIAYEWKYQQGIPIIGTEDEGLYNLSQRFASLCVEDSKCVEDSNAVFQHRTHEDGTEYDIPLMLAWAFTVAARNKRIAQTLIEQVRIYHNPILFAAWSHVKDPRHRSEKKWDKIIKRNLIDTQYMGPMGALMFPWSSTGEDWWLYRHVQKETETFDINYYLEKARIGYTFLVPNGTQNRTHEDQENYKRIFRAQREK